MQNHGGWGFHSMMFSRRMDVSCIPRPLSRQTLYRTKDDPATAEAALVDRRPFRRRQEPASALANRPVDRAIVPGLNADQARCRRDRQAFLRRRGPPPPDGGLEGGL